MGFDWFLSDNSWVLNANSWVLNDNSWFPLVAHSLYGGADREGGKRKVKVIEHVNLH